MVFYEVTITRSDTDGDQWIANDHRVLRRMRDVAYREGWWLRSYERSGPVVTMQYVAVDGATLEQRVRFFVPYPRTLKRRARRG